MRRSYFLAVVAVVALFAAACDFPLMRPPGDAPLRYRDDIFASTVKTADITYGSAQNRSGQTVTLKLDEYAPTGDTNASRPAIVWVHGGSFSGGDKTSPEIVDEATTLGKKGYVNFSINYRLEPGGCSAGGGGTPECLDAINEARTDAQTAVRFVRANASTYKVDPSRIAIAGSSAGAITALEVGYGSGEDASAAVKAVVSLSGANLISDPMGPGDAPALLFHGTSDTTVPYQWAVDTTNHAHDAGLYAYLTTWQGAGHVPYAQHHDEIINQTTNFLYWILDDVHAAQ
jgi:acetyl esterase/lipase